ncbi:MAG: coenzyme F420-0:L-glutamate ligase [Candidatus Peribacteraceae bacterium]|nr:coenzyme F420-0:L-glutamate ligase [Candidatus Peribacteraceae bacterium]
MQVLPIPTPLIRRDDSIADVLIACAKLRSGDIVAVSSKAIATAEGAMIDLTKITPSKEAIAWAKRCGRSAEFRQAVLDETERMHGRVFSFCPLAMLTELRPDGLSPGTILVANAGLDLSNTAEGTAIGWPHDPVESIASIRRHIKEKTGADVAVIITDSQCRPRRWGVVACALAISGLDPLEDLRGREDLFGHTLSMTQEARADQLATAANAVMGNASESIPAAIIRDHGLSFNNFEGWVPGIEPEEDLFRGII